jgi:hypothetical protein
VIVIVHAEHPCLWLSGRDLCVQLAQYKLHSCITCHFAWHCSFEVGEEQYQRFSSMIIMLFIYEMDLEVAEVSWKSRLKS